MFGEFFKRRAEKRRRKQEIERQARASRPDASSSYSDGATYLGTYGAFTTGPSSCSTSTGDSGGSSCSSSSDGGSSGGGE